MYTQKVKMTLMHCSLIMCLSENSEFTRLITAALSISQSVTFRFERSVSALEICQDSHFAEVTVIQYY
jgi:hypothetical protein